MSQNLINSCFYLMKRANYYFFYVELLDNYLNYSQTHKTTYYMIPNRAIISSAARCECDKNRLLNLVKHIVCYCGKATEHSNGVLKLQDVKSRANVTIDAANTPLPFLIFRPPRLLFPCVPPRPGL